MSNPPRFTDIFSAYARVCKQTTDLKAQVHAMQRALDNASDLAVEFQEKYCDLRNENQGLRATLEYLTPTAQELQRENMELKNFVAWIEPTTHNALKRVRELEVENLSMDWVLLPAEPVEESPKTPARQSDPTVPPTPRKRARTARMRTGGLNAQTLRRINSQTQDE